MEGELSIRRNLAWAQCGQELTGVSTHPYYGYLESRLGELYTRRAELQERSVHRPANEQVAITMRAGWGLNNDIL